MKSIIYSATRKTMNTWNLPCYKNKTTMILKNFFQINPKCLSRQGHPTNLFLTLSVPHRNLAGWQNITCSNGLAGKFRIVRGFGWELLTFLAFQAELAEKLWRLRMTEKSIPSLSPRVVTNIWRLAREIAFVEKKNGFVPLLFGYFC